MVQLMVNATSTVLMASHQADFIAPLQDIVFQLRRLMQGLTTFHKECAALMKEAKLFPIEVDLTRNSFQYKSTMPGG